jgi:hypothetical protein
MTSSEKPKLIDQVFCFVASDSDGNEGLTAFLNHQGHWIPMVACDQDRLASMMLMAQSIAAETGTEIKIYHFTHKKHIGTVTKDGLTTL